MTKNKMTASHFQLTADFMDLLMDVVCVVDVDDRIQFISAACERVFGYTPEEMVGRSIIGLIHPDDVKKTRNNIQAVMTGKPNTGFENRYIHKDGHVVDVSWSARWSEADQIRVGLARDITARKRADQLRNALYAISEAAQQTEGLVSLFGQIHRIVGELLPARSFFIALYDETKDELSFPYFVDEKEQRPEPCSLASGTFTAKLIRNGVPLSLQSDPDMLHQLGVPLKSQERTFGAVVVRSQADEVRYTQDDLELLQFVSDQIASAIHRTRLHAHLLYAAGHDPLTGLANRALLQDRLRGILARVRREHARFAVLYLDLDKFKSVNDRFGHAIGDLMLQEVARRLRDCIRESDTIARMGGDEFVVLLDNLLLPVHAQAVARKIQAAFDAPFRLGNEHNSIVGRISVSIGIAVYPDNGEDEGALLQYADNHMFASKQRDQADLEAVR